MRKPEYMPTMTLDSFMSTYSHTGASSALYCFIRDVCKLFSCYGQTEKDMDNLVWLMMAIYSFGRENGIRGERHRRRVKQNGTDDPERTSYTEAILWLLKAADLRKLRLVWVYASHLIR